MSGKKKDKKAALGNLTSVGFISFSDVMGTQTSEGDNSSNYNASHCSITSKSVPVYQGSHAELGMHCRKVLKKDQITKVKALQEMSAIVTNESSTNLNLVPDFLPFFSFLFPRVALENDWKVRERFAQLLQAIIQQDKQLLSPYMKDIIGPWWQMMNDTSNEVKSVYQVSFQTAVPQKKRAQVSKYLSDTILSYSTKFILIQTQELKEMNVGVADEEIMEKMDRLVVSNFYGVGELLKQLNSTAPESTNNEQIEVHLRALLVSKDILRYANSSQWTVRSALLCFLKAVASYYPTLLSSHLSVVSQSMVKGLDSAIENKNGLEQAINIWSDVPAKLGSAFWLNIPIGNVCKKVFSLKNHHVDILADHILPFIASLPFSFASLYEISDGQDGQKAVQANKVFRIILAQLLEWYNYTLEITSFKRYASLSAILEVITYLFLRKMPIDLTGCVINEERVKETLSMLLKVLVGGIREIVLSSEAYGVKSNERQRAGAEICRETVVKTLSLLHKSYSSKQFHDVVDWDSKLWHEILVKVEEELKEVEQEGRVKASNTVLSVLNSSIALAESGAAPSSSAALVENGLIGLYITKLEKESSVLRKENLSLSDIPAFSIATSILAKALKEPDSYISPTVMEIIHNTFQYPWLDLLLLSLASVSREGVPDGVSLLMMKHALDVLSVVLKADQSIFNSIMKMMINDILEATCVTALQMVLSREIGGRIEWNSDQISILREIVLGCLLVGNDGYRVGKNLEVLHNLRLDQRLSLLLSLYGKEFVSDINAELIEQAQAIWKNEAQVLGIGSWYFLSLLASNKPELHWLYNEDFDLAGRIVQAYFSRVIPKNSSIDASNKSKVTSNKICKYIKVDSWRNIESSILPILPNNVFKAVQDAIVHRLNLYLVTDSITRIDFAVWCEHYVKYMQLIMSLNGDWVQEIEKIVLFQVPFYKEKIAMDLYALQCFDTLLFSTHDLSELLLKYVVVKQVDIYCTIRIALKDHLNRNVLTSLDHPKTSAVILDLLGKLLDTIQTLPDADRIEPVGRLSNLIANQNDAAKYVSQNIAVLKEYLPSNGDFQSKNRNILRLRSPLPSPGPCRNMPVYYIAQLRLDNEEIHYRFLPANIISSHLENGIYRPYYTVAVKEAGVVKELQTEWHRLQFTSTDATMDDVDIVKVITEDNITELTTNMSLSASSFADFILTSMLKTLKDIGALVFNLSSSRATSYVRTVPWDRYYGLAEMLSVLMSYFSTNDSLGLNNFAPYLRGLILIAFSLCSSYPKLILVVSKLLHCAVNSRCILGQGLWLPNVLSGFWNDMVSNDLEKSSSIGRVVDRSMVLAGYCEAFASILSVTDWTSALYMCGRAVIPCSLSYCSNYSSSFKKCMNRLLAEYWLSANQAAKQGEDNGSEEMNCVKGWQKESIELLMDEFVLLTSLGTIGADEHLLLNVMVALQGSFENRTRSQQSQLLLSCRSFAEHLHHFYQLTVSYETELQRALVIRYAAELVPSVRLAAAKLLDIYHTTYQQHQAISTLLQQLNVAKEEEEETDEAEKMRDEIIFNTIVGNEVQVELNARYILPNIIARYQPTSKAGGVEENEDEEAEDELATVTTSSTTMNTKHIKQQRKEFIGIWSQIDTLGSVFTWLLMLQSVDSVSSGDTSIGDNSSMRVRCSNHLKVSGLFVNAMHSLLHLAGDMLKTKDLSGLFQRITLVLPYNHSFRQPLTTCSISQLAAYAVYKSICILPSLFRYYYNDFCPREVKQKVSKFIEERVRTSMVRREIALIRLGQEQGKWNPDSFVITGNVQTGEITASFIHDESKIEIRIKLPSNYPLKNVDVQCSSRIGVSDGRWRRWVLQMIQMLSLQDQSVVDAALLWKQNIEKELEGVEPCPICYCTLHNKTLKLPSFTCPTCHHKFHPSCLFTWFKSSGKSNCVLCQQPLFR